MVKKNKSTSSDKDDKRDQEIFRMRDQGLPFSFIGQKFGISRERARQIYESIKSKK